MLTLSDLAILCRCRPGSRSCPRDDRPPGRPNGAFGSDVTGLLGLIVGGPVGWIAGLGIGAGVGAVTAKVVNLGVPDEWVAWFKDAVRPDTATVVVLASNIEQRAGVIMWAPRPV